VKKISALLKYLNKEGFLSEAIMAKRIVSIAQEEPAAITLTSLSRFFGNKNYVIALVEGSKNKPSDYTDKYDGVGNLDNTLYEDYFEKVNIDNDAVTKKDGGVNIVSAGADPLKIAFVVLYDSTISSKDYDEEIPTTRDLFGPFGADTPEEGADVSSDAPKASGTSQETYGNPVGGDNARVSSPYGTRNGGTHKGIDIIDNTGSGSDILSIADGKVLSSYFSETFGNTVIVYHEDLSAGDEAIVSVYGHMKTRSVANSDTVLESGNLGTMGDTGSASRGDHLHLEVRKGPANILDLTGRDGTGNKNAVFGGSFNPVPISYSDFDGVAAKKAK
jgi:murein DD-endopeptidase MepM/ murein hydrolase activator NlpD